MVASEVVGGAALMLLAASCFSPRCLAFAPSSPPVSQGSRSGSTRSSRGGRSSCSASFGSYQYCGKRGRGSKGRSRGVGGGSSRLSASNSSGAWEAWDQEQNSSGESDEESVESRSDSGSGDGSRVDWIRSAGAEIALPPELDCPRGIVHFIGGTGVGAVPRNAYEPLLEGIALKGFAVVATPIKANAFLHDELACQTASDFRTGCQALEQVYGRGTLRPVPVFGVGHSLGAKLHVLLNSYPAAREVGRRRKANVLIAFNNYSADEAVPLLSQLREAGKLWSSIDRSNFSLPQELAGFASIASAGLDGVLKSPLGQRVKDTIDNVGTAEFKPSPETVWGLVNTDYTVRDNFVVQFKRDTIDQSPRLAEALFKRFGQGLGEGELAYSVVDGTHVTPNTPDLSRFDTSDTAARARAWADFAVKGQGQGAAYVFDAVEKGVRGSAEAAAEEFNVMLNGVTGYLEQQALWAAAKAAGSSNLLSSGTPSSPSSS